MSEATSRRTPVSEVCRSDVFLLAFAESQACGCDGGNDRESLSHQCEEGTSRSATARVPLRDWSTYIDVTFSVLLLLATMVIQPFTAPLVAPWVAGIAIPVNGFVLGRNLLLMIGGSMIISVAIRWLVGRTRLEEYRLEISGANLIVFTLFGLAMFDGVVVRTFTQPWLVVGLSAMAFLIGLGSIGAAFVFVRAFGRDDAFITGFAAGHRNVGLMAAAQSGALPNITWLYFALVQLPIYLTPLIVRQMAHFGRQVRLISKIVDGSGLLSGDRRWVFGSGVGRNLRCRSDRLIFDCRTAK